MEKSRLETTKEEAKSKISEGLFTYLEYVLNRLDLPSNTEVKVWKEIVKDPDGEYVKKLQFNKDEYEKFLKGVELDIEKRGKEAIREILDNIIDITEPRLLKILRSHRDLLMEVKDDNK